LSGLGVGTYSGLLDPATLPCEAGKKSEKTLDSRGHVPILRSSFFSFGFSEEKEVIMTGTRNSTPVDEVCVRDIPET
jgi:hypothetical protein